MRSTTSRKTGRRTRSPSPLAPPPPPTAGDPLAENVDASSSMPLSSERPSVGLSPNLVHRDHQIFRNDGSRETHVVENAVSISSGNDDVADEGRNNASLAEALESHSPFNRHRAFYAGDPQGVVQSVMAICADQDPEPQGIRPVVHHQRNAPKPKKAWQTNDLIYLQSKGVFDLPSAEVCDALVQKYFEHVHPLLPVIDAGHFLSQYARNGATAMNLLLLWSVLLAAANFATPEDLQTAGYPSRKAMKRALYARAKALYDSDYEDDKVCVVQSVTLLGFWYSDPEDRSGPWHWMGIAIGLCQVMGLYCTPRSGSLSPYATLRSRLFRRIWWSCFMRDRWLCLGLGRPMRINLEDCQVQMPEPDDITMELSDLDPDVAAKYLPAAMPEHAEIWVRLIHLSVVLGKILRQNTRPPFDHDCFRSCETDLENCRSSARGLDHQNEFSVASLNEFQFELLRQAVIIVLHRSRINFRDPPDSVKTPERVESFRKARSAAVRINRLVEMLIEQDMVQYLRPMKLTLTGGRTHRSLTAIITAMQIHLYECRSSRPLIHNLAWSKLEVCMMVVSELRETYWGANFAFKLFEAAKAMLQKRSHHQHHSGGSGVPGGSSPTTTTTATRQKTADNNNGDDDETTLNTDGLLDEGDALDWFNDPFLSAGPWPMDTSAFDFGESYMNPLYNGISDLQPATASAATAADPWSLDGFQHVLDASFGMDA
ncbi:hypothetical protein AYO20_07844 [Fonsecaea nubica]|uniref:Xylanolytic transcriptional activator regulatory domain-containing protein n=1 Tax=Fonsecaea nubica TaxID=856822 RepID=A0A178CTB6_9EURO|nr:hypothetical protein AYO20_07844 [Fonsecaea nubica]OAL32686.1 hypothetical protein AYO20_07844 [Fonsecaea nubica]